MPKGKMPVDEAFHEVYHDVPKSVKKTGKKGKAKRKMMVAIALSKAGISKPGKVRKGI
jgi:hypothetical protein